MCVLFRGCPLREGPQWYNAQLQCMDKWKLEELARHVACVAGSLYQIYIYPVYTYQTLME